MATSVVTGTITGSAQTFGSILGDCGEEIVTGEISDIVYSITGERNAYTELASGIFASVLRGKVESVINNYTNYYGSGVELNSPPEIEYPINNGTKPDVSIETTLDDVPVSREIDDIADVDVHNPDELAEIHSTGDIETSYGKSSGNYKSTADFLTNVEYRNGKYYADKTTIDEIGQIEARGEDFSILNKKIMSSRASTEGGTSIVYKYSDDFGTKYLIHEVTDADGYIIHRDFDAVKISSGQLINKGY